jgi:tetratricopeptide (TPR) repeat protein
VRRLTTLAALAASLATSLPLAAAPARAQGAEVERAERLFEQRRYADARPLLAAAAGADARAPFYLGRIALVEGDFDAAVRWLERAAREAENDAARHYWLGVAYGQQAQRGSRLRAMGPAKRARAALERAVALDPAHLDARMALVRWYLVVPGIMGGSRGRAEAHAGEIAKRSTYRGHIADGAVREDRGDEGGAIRAYEAAARLHPDSAAAWYALGLLHQERGRTDAAFDAFEKAAAANDAETAALYAIGRLAAVTGERLERGADALRRYLDPPPPEGSPPISSAHFRLGAIHERMGRRDLARREYEAALRIERRGEYRDALRRVQ